MEEITMAQSAVIGNSPFLWEGTDRKGNKIKGKSMAADEAAVRSDLRRQGVVPSKIRKQSKGLFKGGGTIAAADIAIFSRQLATMLSAGIPYRHSRLSATDMKTQPCRS